MVGVGDIWNRPASSDDIQAGNYPSANAPFKSFKCGERGSQISTMDTVIKNVTDSIDESWNNAFGETMISNSTAQRSKRQVLGEPDKQQPQEILVSNDDDDN